MLGRHGTRLSKDKNIAEYMSLELVKDCDMKHREIKFIIISTHFILSFVTRLSKIMKNDP